MGVCSKAASALHSLHSPVMKTLLIALLFLALTNLTFGLFFGTPRSSCSRNSQCRNFARSQCLGASFIFCFGQSRPYTLPGRCIQRSNVFCDIGNVVGGRRDNCLYNECADCLNSQDCGFNEYCSNHSCIQSNTATNDNRK